MRVRTILVTFVVVAALVTGGVIVGLRVFKGGLPIPLRSEYCTAVADGEVTLNLEQMANAATITAVGIRRGVPERAVTVALATALQESKLTNLPGGDRDSIGLFQQRPSQGWGSRKEVADPRYAAGKFYAVLLDVRGWQKMSVTEAAQAVQRSAHPQAYQKWASEAEILGRALLGDASHAIACTVTGAPSARGAIALGALGDDLELDWGSPLARTDITEANSLALRVADDRIGWQYAHWLVAHAENSGIMRVRFGNQQWTAKKGTWVTAGDPETGAPGETVVAQVYGTG